MGQATCSEATFRSCQRHACSHSTCKACNKQAFDGPTEWSPTASQPLFTDDIGSFEPPAVLEVTVRNESSAAAENSAPKTGSNLAAVAAKAISRQIGQRPVEWLELCWGNLREEFTTQLSIWETVARSNRSEEGMRKRPEADMRKELEAALAAAGEDSAAAVRALETVMQLASRERYQSLLSHALTSAIGGVLKAERAALARQRLARMLACTQADRTELGKDLEASRKRSLEALFAACELGDSKSEQRARQLLGLGPKEPSTPSTSVAESRVGFGEVDDGQSPSLGARGLEDRESAIGCLNGQGSGPDRRLRGDGHQKDDLIRVAQLAAERASSKIIEFNVTLDKTHGAALGIDVDGSDGETVVIDAVKDGGLVEVWNEVYPDKAVQNGDTIVEVNGVRGNALRMLDQCKKNQVLEFVVHRRAKRRHR